MSLGGRTKSRRPPTPAPPAATAREWETCPVCGAHWEANTKTIQEMCQPRQHGRSEAVARLDRYFAQYHTDHTRTTAGV